MGEFTTAIDRYKENEPLYQELLSQTGELLANNGIDLHGDSSQSSTYGEATNITQDQASEISGRLTALQWSGEKRLELQTILSQDVASILSLTTNSSTYLSELRTAAISSNSYLEDIQKDTRKIYSEWGEKITRIDKNINDKL